MKKTFSVFVIALTLFAFGCTPKQPQEEPIVSNQKVIHPRIYWTENPAEHAIISWTSLEESQNNKVFYDTQSRTDTGQYIFQSLGYSNGRISYNADDAAAGVPEAWFHHTDVQHQMPGKKIYYRYCSDQTCSEEYYFITPQQQSKNLSLLFGGDSRVGKEGEEDSDPANHSTRQKMNKTLAKLMEQKPEILALVHGADYGMNASWKYLYHWFNDHELTITSDNRVLPLIISRGNHDHEIGFTENFRLGSVTEKNSDGYYYTTQITDSIALITLNTETSMAGYQYKWLKKELEKQRPANQWLLVQYHKPAYPAVKDFDREDFARVRKYWVPLFEEFEIDLVLESDGHALKKTVPILKDKPNPKGIIYIGEGGLGVPQRIPNPNRWYFQNGGHASSHHHVWLLEFNGDVLKSSALGIDLENILDFEIVSKK